MNTNNQAQATTASLIEELRDADLENYVGGLGVINPVVQAIPRTPIQYSANHSKP